MQTSIKHYNTILMQKYIAKKWLNLIFPHVLFFCALFSPVLNDPSDELSTILPWETFPKSVRAHHQKIFLNIQPEILISLRDSILETFCYQHDFSHLVDSTLNYIPLIPSKNALPSLCY